LGHIKLFINIILCFCYKPKNCFHNQELILIQKTKYML
jgi:hypothetical protein